MERFLGESFSGCFFWLEFVTLVNNVPLISLLYIYRFNFYGTIKQKWQIKNYIKWLNISCLAGFIANSLQKRSFQKL